KATDLVGEVVLTVVSGGEAQVRAGCEVVDDLRHRPSLVRAASVVGLNGDWVGLSARVRGARELTVGDVGGLSAEGVIGVGEDADGHAGPVNVVLCSSHVRVQHRVALGDGVSGRARS